MAGFGRLGAMIGMGGAKMKLPDMSSLLNGAPIETASSDPELAKRRNALRLASAAALAQPRANIFTSPTGVSANPTPQKSLIGGGGG